jgi:uncharacterized protein YqiB (DUF1249 family)
MLISNRTFGHRGVRARDLPALMELYELNYILLRRLIPEHDLLADTSISSPQGALDLHLEIVERAPYTTTLRLTYLFRDADGPFPAPDVLVRMYHDAQVAEVITRGRRRGRRDAEYDRSRERYTLERKWEVNRFLHKWLGYCLHQCHAFSPGRDEFSKAAQRVAGGQLVDVES